MPAITPATARSGQAVAVPYGEDIDHRIARLTALRSELQRSFDACGHGQVSECQVIDALAEMAAK